MIVPVRWELPVLTAALILNEPLPVRLVGLIFEMVNQLALLLTLHVAFDVTLTVVLVATGPGAQVLRESVLVALAWVTLIVRVGAAGAVTVIVPVRAAVVVLVVVFILNEPLPVRFVGVILEMVNQLALLLTFHVAFDVTSTVLLSAATPADHVLRESVRVFPLA